MRRGDAGDGDDAPNAWHGWRLLVSGAALSLGAKLGTAAGEHGEVVGAIVLIGIAGAMAMDWL